MSFLITVFLFQAKSPDPCQIPDVDLVGVTVVLLTCSYNDREFVRVGYYVNNEYTEEEMRENPPARPVIEKVHVESNYFLAVHICMSTPIRESIKSLLKENGSLGVVFYMEA